MLPTTARLLRTALEADPTVRVCDRRRLMALLRDGVEPPTQPTKPTEPRLLRRAEVARRLGCSVRLVDRLATEGVLPKHRLPNRRRAAGVLEADLIALITASPLPAPRQTVEAT